MKQSKVLLITDCQCGYDASRALYLKVLILLLLVSVVYCVPVPNSSAKGTVFPKNAPSAEPSSDHTNDEQQFQVSTSSIESNPTSTHLAPLIHGPFQTRKEPSGVHITKEVSRVSFQVVEEISGSRSRLYPPAIISHSVADINLEPTEVEAPGTTPTTIPLVSTTNSSLSSNKRKFAGSISELANSSTFHMVPIIKNIYPLKITSGRIKKTEDTPYNVNKNNKIFNKNDTANGKITEKDYKKPFSSEFSIENKEQMSNIDSSLIENDFDVMLADAPLLDNTKSERLRTVLVKGFSKHKVSEEDKHSDISEPDTTLTDMKKESFDTPEDEKKFGDDLYQETGIITSPEDNKKTDTLTITDALPILESIDYASKRPVFLKQRDAEPDIFFEALGDRPIQQTTISVTTFPTTESPHSPEDYGQIEVIESSIQHELKHSEGGNPSISVEKRCKVCLKSTTEESTLDDYYEKKEEKVHLPFISNIPKHPSLPIEDSEESSTSFQSGSHQRGSFSSRDEELTKEFKSQEYSNIDEETLDDIPNPDEVIANVGGTNKEEKLLPKFEAHIATEHNFSHGYLNRSGFPKIALPSSDHIISSGRSNAHLIPPSTLESDALDPIVDDYNPGGIHVGSEWSKVASGRSLGHQINGPRLEKVSAPVSQPISEELSAGCVAAITLGVILCIGAALGGFAFIMYHRQTDIRPKVLSSDRSCSNSDSGGYIDDQCRVAYVNSQLDIPKGTPEDLVSLDNDSFLNSLESMTIQNLWTDSIRHTKL